MSPSLPSHCSGVSSELSGLFLKCSVLSPPAFSAPCAGQNPASHPHPDDAEQQAALLLACSGDTLPVSLPPVNMYDLFEALQVTFLAFCFPVWPARCESYSSQLIQTLGPGVPANPCPTPPPLAPSFPFPNLGVSWVLVSSFGIRWVLASRSPVSVSSVGAVCGSLSMTEGALLLPQVHREVIPTHTVYALNIERVITKLWHPNHEELQQDRVHRQRLAAKEGLLLC